MAAIAAFWHSFSGCVACTLEEMAGILREALAAETNLKVKRRPQGASRPEDHAAWGLHHPSSYCLPSGRSTGGWAGDGRACVSPSSSSTSSRSSADTAEWRRSVTDDEEELQAKLAKEQYSTEGLPALYMSPGLRCESAVVIEWDATRDIKLEPGV
eukprot:3934976-Rhodomonas_salina.1